MVERKLQSQGAVRVSLSEAEADALASRMSTLSRSDRPEERLEAAKSPFTSRNNLRRLREDPQEDVRIAAVNNMGDRIQGI